MVFGKEARLLLARSKRLETLLSGANTSLGTWFQSIEGYWKPLCSLIEHTACPKLERLATLLCLKVLSFPSPWSFNGFMDLPSSGAWDSPRDGNLFELKQQKLQLLSLADSGPGLIKFQRC
ncbi:hypothetical protein BY996DRAFT_6428254 [Phakopsora pachyrhizi]|nr:hypothetical protein BY996DRAFT_6428254 [Phakopsora pachyrhizi]